MGKLRDLLGLKFANLTVVSREPNDANNKAVWKCVCDCGRFKIVASNCLTRGNVQSCGCLYRITAAPIIGARGLSKHPVYNTWSTMKQRCHNPKNKNYAYYGGRGIKVCDRWLESFANFLEDVGERPSDQHFMDRRDNDGNYCPENFRWVTKKDSNRNKRSSANSSSRYKGVHWSKKNLKWIASIHYDNTSTYLGSFTNEWEAAQAYNQAAKDAFGEYANLNIETLMEQKI